MTPTGRQPACKRRTIPADGSAQAHIAQHAQQYPEFGAPDRTDTVLEAEITGANAIASAEHAVLEAIRDGLPIDESTAIALCSDQPTRMHRKQLLVGLGACSLLPRTTVTAMLDELAIGDA